MSASERVREYLRQSNLKIDKTVIIHSVWSDAKAEMAHLSVADLEEVLEIAEQYEMLCD